MRILEEAEGMPLPVIDPRDVDVRVPAARGRRTAEPIRYDHGHTHAGGQYVEGGGLDLLAHEEVHVTRVEGVQYDARTEDGRDVPPVRYGVRRHVKAKSDGEEVKEEMETSFMFRDPGGLDFRA